MKTAMKTEAKPAQVSQPIWGWVLVRICSDVVCWRRKVFSFHRERSSQRNERVIDKRIQLTCDIFLNEAAAMIKIVATKENQLVQTACPEKTLNAIETPRIPEPVKRT
jgi:hypothetical protein